MISFEERAKKESIRIKSLPIISYDEIVNLLSDTDKEYKIIFDKRNDTYEDKHYSCVNVWINNSKVGEYLDPDKDAKDIYTNMIQKLSEKELELSLQLFNVFSWHYELCYKNSKNELIFPREIAAYFAENASSFSNIEPNSIWCLKEGKEELFLPSSLGKSETLKAKEKAGVLLISKNEETYLNLKKYGFKNVDWFKSIVRADKYFKEHPEELKKYHLILEGERSFTSTSNRDVDLDRTLHVLRRTSNTVVKFLNERRENSGIKYYKDGSNIGAIASILDSFIDYMISNDTLNKCDYVGEFKPIEDIVKSKLPLPTKKSDLKILYLMYFLDEELEAKLKAITDGMGLNVTFIDDVNSTLGNIKDKLGDYDIIIAGNLHSNGILNLNEESTEQCKDTGRELVLLATYKCNARGNYDFIAEPKGYKIELSHIYAGDLADDSIICEREINVLDDKTDDELCLSVILSAAIEAYNEKLPTPINDLDLRSASEYDNEYQLALDKIREKEALISDSMEIFDEIRDTVSMYMDYRKNGLIVRDSNGNSNSNNGNRLRIRRSKYGLISIENYYQNKMNFAMSFFDGYSSEDSKVLSIKVGNLPSKKVCIYTKKPTEKKAFAPLASETQLEVLKAFSELIEKTLNPLILTAVENYSGKGPKKKV